MALVMASGCVFNNCIDRDIDKLMERTKNRASALGLVSVKTMLLYGIVLGVLGTWLLYSKTNLLAVSLGLFGLFVYVGIYTLWMKRHSVFGTFVGSVAGAMPPVMGYCAASNRFDMGAVILFLILCLWQMPHSYAIAIYRKEDYARASIPVLPLKKGIRFTKISMILFTIAFAVVAVMPTIYGYTGIIYLIISLGVGIAWILMALSGLYTQNDALWARKMFLFSIIGIVLLFITMTFA